MAKLILLNGPPSSGKDTAAKEILRRNYWNRPRMHRFRLDRMSMPIKRAFAGFMQAPIDEYGNVDPYEYSKEQIIPELGVSYRQWQIDFSEHFIKAHYPIRTFGNLLVQRCKRRFEKGICDVIVVPDCGFDIEVKVLYEAFSPEDILMIQVIRIGFDFRHDSRSYVYKPENVAIGKWLAIQNESLDAFRMQIDLAVEKFLGE